MEDIKEKGKLTKGHRLCYYTLNILKFHLQHWQGLLYNLFWVEGKCKFWFIHEKALLKIMHIEAGGKASERESLCSPAACWRIQLEADPMCVSVLVFRWGFFLNSNKRYMKNSLRYKNYRKIVGTFACEHHHQLESISHIWRTGASNWEDSIKSLIRIILCWMFFCWIRPLYVTIITALCCIFKHNSSDFRKFVNKYCNIMG